MPSPAPNLPGAPAVTADDLAGDQVRSGDPLFGVVWINAERLSGAPCFFGTRVPVRALFDYLRAGRPIGEFLSDFAGVTRTQVETVLRHAPELFEIRGRAA